MNKSIAVSYTHLTLPTTSVVVPQLAQTLNFDLKEVIIRKAIISNSMGVKNSMIRIFPNKLNKKLNPKKKITRKGIIL